MSNVFCLNSRSCEISVIWRDLSRSCDISTMYVLLWPDCVDEASASIVHWFSAFFYHLAAFFYHLAAWAQFCEQGPHDCHLVQPPSTEKHSQIHKKVGALLCHPTNRMIFCLQSFHRMKIVVLFVASHASNMTLDLKTSSLYNLFQ